MIHIAGRRSFSLFRSKLFLGIPVICIALIAGCATTPNADQLQAKLESLFKEADAELSNGQQDKAIALLNQAARENPTNMAPWLKMANIWFDAGNYPSSIQAANEVVQRDPGNQEAKSLLVVAGLRVAANSVAGLRSPNGVNTNVRAEAESLTNSLRTALGEKVLVPTPGVESRPVSHSSRSKARSAAPRAPAHGTATQTAGAGSADPFKSLK